MQFISLNKVTNTTPSHPLLFASFTWRILFHAPVLPKTDPLSMHRAVNNTLKILYNEIRVTVPAGNFQIIKRTLHGNVRYSNSAPLTAPSASHLSRQCKTFEICAFNSTKRIFHENVRHSNSASLSAPSAPYTTT